MMQLHLDEISRNVAEGAHAVLLLDRAGWHTTGKLDVPDNITPIFLPSRAPELNPVENVWQYLRQNWLSNTVFENYDAIVDAACAAWRKLIADPETITSIGMRDWAHVGQLAMTFGIIEAIEAELAGLLDLHEGVARLLDNTAFAVATDPFAVGTVLPGRVLRHFGMRTR